MYSTATTTNLPKVAYEQLSPKSNAVEKVAHLLNNGVQTRNAQKKPISAPVATPRAAPQNPGTDGSYHFMPCQTQNCGLKIHIWIPTDIPYNFHTQPFLCNFCLTKKVSEL